MRDPYTDPRPGDVITSTHWHPHIERKIVLRGPNNVTYLHTQGILTQEPRNVLLVTWRRWCRNYATGVWAESALGDFAVAHGIYYDSDARLIAAAPELHGCLAAIVAEAAAKGVDLQSLPAAHAALAKLLTAAKTANGAKG